MPLGHKERFIRSLLDAAALISLLTGAFAADTLRAPAKVTVHTVVPTECTMYFSWQSLGIFYSHRKAGQDGPITRIISCTDEQKRTYKDMDLVPSHVVPSLTIDAEHNDVYSAYNKPGAVMYWLQDAKPQEDFILVIDADMIMRQPFDPVGLGAGPGWAISAFFTYMKGVSNELAMRHVPQVKPRNDTLAGPVGRRGDQVGGFTLMTTKDLERVAPLWLSFTTAVRNDPTAWNTTGDSYSIHPGDKPWISEMYGYSYGCSTADVWHKVDFGAMLYPAYYSAAPPKVLHYGLIYEVPNTNYTFDKHWHYDFDATACPPWDMTTDHPKRGLFPHPPPPSSFKNKGEELLRELLSIQVIVELNVAFCERHLTQCPPSEQLTKECTYAKEMEAAMDDALVEVEYQISVDSCKDHDDRCQQWARGGECEANPGFMINNCKISCNQCTVPMKPKPTKKAPALPARIAITSPVDVGSRSVKLQDTARKASDAASDTARKASDAASDTARKASDAASNGVQAASDAAAGVVTAGQHVLTQGKKAASQVADKASDAAASIAKTGKEAAGKTQQVAASVSDEVKAAVQEALRDSEGATEEDSVSASLKKKRNTAKFQEAAQQRDAEDIADVLDVQAADAEDERFDEDLEQSEAELAASLGNTDSQGGAASKAGLEKAVTTAKDAASDAVAGAGQAANAVVKPLTDGKVAGVTEDVHEADLDLSHTDKAPDVKTKADATKDVHEADLDLSLTDKAPDVKTTADVTKDVKEADLDLRHSDGAPDIGLAGAAVDVKPADLGLLHADTGPVVKAAGATKDLPEADVDLSHADKAPVIDDSIEADSIAKSDHTQTSRKDLVDSARDLDKTDAQQGADAATNSLDLLHGSAATAGKAITDPEQAFLLQGADSGGKQPGSRSQKLELGKGRTTAALTTPASHSSLLSRLVTGRISRRAVLLGVLLWILSVLGFLTVLKLPRAQNLRRKPLLRRKGQPSRQH